MPPWCGVMRYEPLCQALAEMEEAQYRPQQEVQRIVPHIASERILHRVATHLVPGSLQYRARIIFLGRRFKVEPPAFVTRNLSLAALVRPFVKNRCSDGWNGVE